MALEQQARKTIDRLLAAALPPRLMVAQRLIKQDRPPPPQRYVEVRRPFWGARLNEQARPDMVPLVLVYADLLATNDGRCIETAQKIYEDHLARLLPAA